MATATKTVRFEEVEKVVKDIQSFTEVMLKLSDDEAKALACILGAVGGPPSTTRRKLARSILQALTDQGYTFVSSMDPKHDIEGYIYFLSDRAVAERNKDVEAGTIKKSYLEWNLS